MLDQTLLPGRCTH